MNRACRGRLWRISLAVILCHSQIKLWLLKAFRTRAKCLKTLTYDYEIQILEFVEENRINNYADY